MLNLQSTSSESWLKQVDASLDEILVDHAHCEHKAAATAMSLMGSYIDNQDLCEEMTRIVEEELEHFHMVIKLLNSRGIPFTRQQPGHYGKELKALVRPNEPNRAVDRLLVASLPVSPLVGILAAETMYCGPVYTDPVISIKYNGYR